MAAATEHGTQVYVERLSDGWRCLAHEGGSYRLLRTTARFQVEHFKVVIGFRTLPDGFAVLCDDPNVVQQPEVAAVIEFARGSSPAIVTRRIVDVLGPAFDSAG